MTIALNLMNDDGFYELNSNLLQFFVSKSKQIQNDMNSYLFFKKSYSSNEFFQCGKKTHFDLMFLPFISYLPKRRGIWLWHGRASICLVIVPYSRHDPLPANEMILERARLWKVRQTLAKNRPCGEKLECQPISTTYICNAYFMHCVGVKFKYISKLRVF